MESRRLVLLALLGVIGFFIYQTWVAEHPKPVAAASKAAAVTASVAAPRAVLPSASSAAGPSAEPAPPVSSAPSARPATQSPTLTVTTDKLAATIALRGGGISRLRLLAYPYDKQHPDRKLALLNDGRPYFVFQAGIAGTATPLADSDTRYRSPKASYTLAAGETQLEVPLSYEDARGYTVRQTYIFRRGSYQVQLRQSVRNDGANALVAAPYARFVRDRQQAGPAQKFIHAFFGLGVYEQRNGSDYRFEKKSFDDLLKHPYQRQQRGGWLALLQQYFIGAILPSADEPVRFDVQKVHDGRVAATVLGPGRTLAAGSEKSFSTRLYLGPKLHGKLAAVAPGLDLTEDYGLFTVIAKPLFWVLAKIHALSGNWGVAIILLTLLVRGAFFKLSEAQYRSMARMRKFAPRIQELRERYADDREHLQRAMMELYKKEGFNPLAGCWPILIQFPVFIALYYVLIQSVELRQAPFVLWINDLSAPDPLYLLPIVYGATMWVQQKFSGQTATMEPTQQKIMQVMPIGLAAFFTFFPSGLVLYYVVSNLFTIAQQWVIIRRLEKEGLHR